MFLLLMEEGTLNDNSGSEPDRRRPCKKLVDKLTTPNGPRLKVRVASLEMPWTSNRAW